MFKLNNNDPNFWLRIANIGIVIIIGWAVAMSLLGFF